MKTTLHTTILFAGTMLLCGCIAQRPVQQAEPKEEFFRPILARQNRADARSHETELNNAKLAAQMQGSMKQVDGLRDSLMIVSRMTRDLLDRIAKLEENQILARNKEAALAQQLVIVQQENRRLEQQVSTLNAMASLAQNPDIPKIVKPASESSTMLEEYEGALGQFLGRQYDQAIDSFKGLLTNGIEEDLADNCEYWIGESHFAMQEYKEALASFEKVITLPVSNKKADAYVMIGQTYEKLHDIAKARWAYEELLAHFPNADYAPKAKMKLKQLQIPAQSKSGQKRAAA